MPRYRVYEDYEYTTISEVEADNEEQALEMIVDDPYEYRISDAQDEEARLIRKVVEKQDD